MLIVSHALILAVGAECSSETQAFHKILTHNMFKDCLVIV
jgi:hypothetical protein